MIKTTFKAHPIMLFSLMRPYLFVLVLPLIRALVQYITEKQINGLLNLEIIAFSFALITAFFSYRAISVTVVDGYLIVKKGIFIKRRAVIEASRLSSIVLRRNVIDIVFGSVECAVNTEAGRPQKSDFAFKMYFCDTKRLFSMVYGQKECPTVKISPTKIALLAATTSSAFSGMIVGVPVINQLGDLLGVALSDMFLNEINSVSSKIDTIFPPVVNTVTLVFLFAYALSFSTTFLKNVKFKLQSDAHSMEIKSGLVVRRHIMFKKSKINDVCIEQTPLMRLVGLFSMRASVGGYSDSKGERPVIIPVAKHQSLLKELKSYFLQYSDNTQSITPLQSKLNLNRFLFMPTVWLAVVVAASVVSALLFERFSTLIVFIMAVLIGVDLYYAYVCYQKYKSSRLSLDESILAVGIAGFNTREMYCSKNNIGIIKIIQTPADRRHKTCKVKLVVRSEQADGVRVDNLDINSVFEKLKSLFDLKIMLFNE